MNDTISRHAAIELLNERKKIFCKNHIEFTILSKEDKARVDEISYCIITLKGLPSAQQEQRWIPVKERLPIPNEKDVDGISKYYLIQNKFGDMMVARYIERSGTYWWEQMYQYKPIEDRVVAWMPLPEPYRKETEDGRN